MLNHSGEVRTWKMICAQMEHEIRKMKTHEKSGICSKCQILVEHDLEMMVNLDS